MSKKILVAGAGPAGVVAALAAARNGANVTLVERYGFAGGSATMPMPILGFMTSEEERLVAGIPQEIIDRIQALGGCRGHFPHPVLESYTSVDSEILKCVLDEMLREAGVNCLFHSLVTGVKIRAGQISKVSIQSKEGCHTLPLDFAIDATGDADLAAVAGVPCEVGRNSDGLTQSVTIQFVMGNVDINASRDYVVSNPDDSVYPVKRGSSAHLFMGFQSLVSRARNEGVLSCYPRDYVIFHTLMRDDMVGVNTTKVNVTGLNPENLTKAEIEGRKQTLELVQFLREYVPGFEDSVLLYFPTHLGIRETRRIVGRYVLTIEDIQSAANFPDGIARCRYPVDIHDPSEQGPVLRNLDEPYSVPFSSLQPKNVKNLLVAGRCLSASHEALASVRVMATCMAMGQAAGTAAAICLKRGVAQYSIDVKELQTVLKEQGALL